MTLSKKPVPYDVLLEKVQNAFDERHPTSSLPDWFQTSVFRYERVNANKKIEVKYYVHGAKKLRANQKWIETPSGSVLQEKNEDTGEIEIVMMRDHGNAIILFFAIADPMTGSIEILKDADISKIKGEDVEHPRSK